MREEQELLISRYDDPDLTDPERQELDALLDGEPEARAIVEQYRKLDDQLATLADLSSSVDFDRFRDGVNDKLDRLQARRPVRRLLWRVLVPLSAAAVFLLVALPWIQSFGPRVVEVKTGGIVAIPTDVPRVVQVQKTGMIAGAEPVVNIQITQIEVDIESDAEMQNDRVICFATSLPESNSSESAIQSINEELYL
jgi:anti-sigma factor RsiW